MSNESENTRLKLLLDRSLFWHRILFIVGLATLFLINWLTSSSGWFFWTFIGWGVVFTLHYFIVKSITMDEDWAYDRTADLRQKSYDWRHISDIRSSYIIPRKSAAKQKTDNESSNNESNNKT